MDIEIGEFFMIVGIYYVVIFVLDLECVVEFYVGLFGFEEV